MKEILFVKFSDERNDNYKIKTAIVRFGNKKYVEKSAVGKAAEKHILSLYDKYKKLEKRYVSDRVIINKCEKTDNCMRFEFVEGIGLDKRLDHLLFDKKNYDAVLNEIEDYFNAVTNVEPCIEFQATEKFNEIFGIGYELDKYKCCDISNIDVVFSNVMVKNGVYNILDYEWTFDFPVPIKFIEYRTILNYILDNPKRGILVDKGVFKRFNITDDEIKYFDSMERSFQRYVRGSSLDFAKYYNMLCVKNHDMVDTAERLDADVFKNIVDIFYDFGNGVVPESVVSMRNINKDGRGCIEAEVKKGCRAVRIDPITDYCILSNINIKAINSEKTYTPEFGSNGYKVDNDVYIFDNPDTQFYIAVNKDTLKVVMSYDITIVSKAFAEDIIHEFEEKEINANNLLGIINELNERLDNSKKEIEYKESIISDKNLLIEEKEKLIDSSSQQIAQLNKMILDKNANIESLYNTILSRDNQIKEIYNSTSWKITSPMRFAVTRTKQFFRNNSITGKGYEFMFYVKKLGCKGAVEHYRKINRRKNSTNNLSIAYSSVVDKKSIVPLINLNKSVAVHLHLYYVDLLDEFIGYFNNIPFKFDLFVSCRESSKLGEISNRLKKIKNVKKVDVRETINRGRDIAPLYVQFGNEIEKYDYFLHVHSKKSIYSGHEQYGWRQYSLDCLLKNEEIIRKIFALFESDNIGLFYPETFGDMPMIAQDWLENAHGGRTFLNEIGIPFEDGFFNYPVGSFFWAKTDALRPVFDRKLKYDDFPEEAGQTDGTLAHVLERAISFVAKSRGYKDAIHDIRSNQILIGKSYKIYENYFSLNVDSTEKFLEGYDIISFDIFDTLITRIVYEPDDIFNIMKLKLEKELQIKCDFINLRKKAESIVWEKKKEYTSINDIYEMLKHIMKIPSDKIEKIKEMEINLEINLCIPRRDMLKVFNYLKLHNKKIVLISDMYLTSDIVEKMLKKCGYEGYDDIWISCEKGGRKDCGTIWNEFISLYGEMKTIHVGDNPCSDIQTVIDRKREAFFVINPRTAFKMSSVYERFIKYIDGSIFNSIMMGLFINGGIYNSPFCQQINGEPEISEYDVMGYCGFGPLFAVFSIWLNNVTDIDDTLMFLAREGYIFENFYNKIYSNNKDKKRESVYFLASRRAASVAAIRDEEDIRGILAQYYRGSFSNLMKSRLGIELFNDIEDRQVSMSDDLDYVMTKIKPHLQSIYDKAKVERENYINYIKNLGIGNNGVIVDVGYSGTIQYYMVKLLNNKLPGAYLCTSTNRKPEKLGCRVSSLYSINDISEERTNPIFRNQLFLEAVLKAPYGQLICFKNRDGEIVPEHKEDCIVADELKKLQKGIIDFAVDFSRAAEGFIDELGYNVELASDMISACLECNWMSERVADIMTVQDDYCENGSHKFNAKSGKWEVIK